MLFIVKQVRETLGASLWIHGWYTLIGVLFFAPLVAGVGQRLIQFSGESMLSDMDIIYFIFSLKGLVATLGISALILTILVSEQVALLHVQVSNIQQKKLSPLTLFLRVLGETRHIFLFSAHLLARFFALVIPALLIIALLVKTFLTTYDINYYLSATPLVFKLVVFGSSTLILATAIGMITVSLRWVVALPLTLFAAVPPKNSFGQSAVVTKDKKASFLGALMAWALIALGGSSLIMGGAFYAGSLLLPLFYDSLKAMVFLMGLIVVGISLAQFMVSALVNASFSALILSFSQTCGIHFHLPDISEEKQWARPFYLRLPVLALLLLMSSSGVGLLLFNQSKPRDTVAILAHRGAAGKAPENTMAAIHQAIADGTDWVEIDVQESSDGEVVVIHDQDFMKIAGVSTKVWQAPLSELKSIDIGSWFDPRFSHERIPTFKEVLLAAKGKCKVLIELKYYGHDEQLEQRVIDIVEETEMQKSVALMSLKKAGILKAHDLRPQWEMGLLLSKSVGSIKSLEVDFFAMNSKMLKRPFIKRVHKLDKKVYVWTLNDAISMNSALSLGVDGIITDEPELARKVMVQREQLNTIEHLLLYSIALLGKPAPQKEYRDESP